MDTSSNYLFSTLRERIVEHVFVGDLLRALWRLGIYDVEVLKSEFDAHGYDLVLARGPVVRHVQFKTGKEKKPGKVSISRSLAEKPSGCVIWIRLTQQLDMGPFFWLGGLPGAPLPKIDHFPSARRTTPNRAGERPIRKNHVEVPGSAFTERPTLDAVLADLFGDLTPSSPEDIEA